MNIEIRKAFDPIRADPALLQKTRQALWSGTKPVLRKRHNRLRAAAIAVLVILLTGLILSVGLSLTQMPVAAVSVDINPGIALDINLLSRVIAAKGFNEQGEDLLAGLDLHNKPVPQALEAIVAAAARQGWLASDGSTIIAVTASTDLAVMKGRLERETGAAVQQALAEEGSQAVVYQAQTGLERVREARELNITPGRLNLIQRLIELAPDTAMEDYLTVQISDIMKEIIELKKERQNQEKETAENNKATRKETQASIRESRAAEKDDHATPDTAPSEDTGQGLSNLPGQTDEAAAAALDRIESALNQAQENRSFGNGRGNGH